MEIAILDFIFSGTALTLTGARKLAIYQTDPLENVTHGSAGEPTGGAYARTAITFGAAVTSAGLGTILNSADVVFPQATAVWRSGVDLAGWAIFDSTATNIALMHGTFLVAKPVLSGDTAKVLKDNLTLTLD